MRSLTLSVQLRIVLQSQDVKSKKQQQKHYSCILASSNKQYGFLSTILILRYGVLSANTTVLATAFSVSAPMYRRPTSGHIARDRESASVPRASRVVR